ncbi:helix-turn-helix domain-containing protein [Kitasatospora sp. NPDC097605]|uniref:TetR/AcrR family transcriptional regulator n=1 Tax=Kitasatospora sp. NPDC097605 TaxID=3157226 RepID=UPI00332561F3
MSGTQDRPLRADAARNRAKLLDAATEVFTTRGVGVPTEEIARAAGVGVGTLFRHFPTKEALLEAVMVRRLEIIATGAARAAADSEPAEALFACFRLIAEQSVGKTAFAEALAAAGVDVHTSLRAPSTAIRDLLADLLHRAQHAGTVRPELTLPELLALLVGANAALEHAGPTPTARDHILTVLLTGLRPPEQRA